MPALPMVFYHFVHLRRVSNDVEGETSVLDVYLRPFRVIIVCCALLCDVESLALHAVGNSTDDVAFHLPQPRHCNEGEEDGDDGFLGHIYFVLLSTSWGGQ